MGAEGAKLETVLGYLLPARSRYLVQRAPTLSTIEKPPAKAVFSFLVESIRARSRSVQEVDPDHTKKQHQIFQMLDNCCSHGHIEIAMFNPAPQQTQLGSP